MPPMKRWVCLGLMAAGLLRPASGQTNGIFADFSTSKGNFTVWLDYERAPRAVASFVGLATGAGGWLDAQSNVWHRPFYDGSIFHRVVKVVESNEFAVWTNGIAIQGGGHAVASGTATNFAGPGYAMLEGVTNGLAHSNGVISMANSGPNTDGSQFFITATNVPGWDGSYSVFGHVAAGMDVVASIAAVAVQGAGSRPVEDVVLSNVVIRRVGEAAKAFDISGQGVPSPESTPMRVDREGTNLNLRIEVATQTKPLRWSESPTLMTWTHDPFPVQVALVHTGATYVMSGAIPLASMGDKYFFHTSRLRYPVPVTSPTNNRASPGRKFTFWWSAATPTKYEVVFAASPTNQGVYQATVGTNAPVSGLVFTGDSWTREAYSARLYFFDNSGKEQTYSLGFNPGQPTNRFTGTVKDWIGGSTYSIMGVFTVQ